MAQPSTILSAAFDEKQLSNSLERGINAGMRNTVFGKGFDTRALNQSFRGLNNEIRSFDKQLDSTNRRVLAFGASATIIYGTVRAFKELVTTTIEVQKSLGSINSIFRLSARDLDSFGKDLFNVAKQTGQSFRDVASAAEEFSRQGFDATETAKRTRDAMILVRLSGVDATKAVNGLTAAMATFGKTGIDTTTIINKLITVDQQFAVSAGGIIDAFTKVGSTLDDAGVNLDQFIGLVTAARQITGRSEAQIGNSLKTILTRLERSSTVEQLEAFGVAVRDSSGAAKDALGVLDALAKSYSNLTREQQQQVAELGAGVFQINQFKALVQDLGKANGIYAQSTKVAARDTGDALIRNEALNRSLAASLNTLKASAQQVGSVAGELAINPALSYLTKGTDTLINSLFARAKATGDTRAGEDFGAYMGESILKGLGNVLLGPGLILMSKALVGTAVRVARDSVADFRSAVGFADTEAAKGLSRFGFSSARGGETAQLTTVNSLLEQATRAEQARYTAARTLAEQETAVLAILERQLAVQNALAARAGGGGLRGGAGFVGRGRAPGAAEGYVPLAEEAAAIARGVGGAPRTARPVYLPGFNRGGGQRGIVANSSEWAAGGTIYNRDMIQRGGLPPGAKPIAAGGYIPNAANSYNVPSVYRSGPPSNPPMVMGVPWGGYPPSTYMSGPSGPAMGQGFGQYAGASTSQVAAKQLENAAYERRVIAQREVTAKAEVGAFQAEQARIRALKGLTNVQQSPATLGETRAYRPYPIPAELGGTTPPPFPPGYVERVRVQRELAAQRTADRRYARLNNTAGRVQLGTLAASFGSAFLPEGESGRASGMLSGALSTGFQGSAIGAGLGSTFGPMGTLIGAAVGGLGGGIAGLISRSSKSFEELAKDIEETNREAATQVENAMKVFQLDDQEADLRANGGSARDIARVRRQRTTAIASITDAEVRAALLGRGSNPNARADVARLAGGRQADTGSSNSLFTSIALMTSKGGAFGLGGKDSKAAAAALQPLLAGLSDSQIKALGSLATNDPQKALESLARMGKLTPEQQQETVGSRGVLGGINGAYRTITEDHPVSTSLFSALFPALGALGSFSSFAQQKSGASTAQTIQKAISDIEASNARSEVNKPFNPQVSPSYLRKLGNTLTRQLALQNISPNATLQINQAAQRAFLDRPELFGTARIAKEGAFNEQNIRDQFAIQQRDVLTHGKAHLISDNKLTDPDVVNKIRNAQGLGDLQALLKKGALPGLSDEAMPQFRTAIEQLTIQMEALQKAELEGINVNQALVDIQTTAYRRSLTMAGAQAEDAGAVGRAMEALTAAQARNEDPTILAQRVSELMDAVQRRDVRADPSKRDAADISALQRGLDIDVTNRQRQNRAIRGLAGQGSNLVTGSQLEQAILSDAQIKGQQGDAQGSFVEAFRARFDGLKQDLMDFSTVGAQIGASLESSLGNAFGDFVTGAMKGKDAFRSFAFSVMNDAARAFASKGVQQLLSWAVNLGLQAAGSGGGGGGFQSIDFINGSGAPPTAAGGPIGLARGGSVSARVMRGEWIFGPAAARRIGPAGLHAINSGTVPLSVQRKASGGALVTGGSGMGDDVNTALSPGSFVIRKAMVDRYGVSTLARMAGGGNVSITGTPTTGDVMGAMLPQGFNSGGATASIMATPTPAVAASGGNVHVSTSVVINDQRTSATSETSGSGPLADKQFGANLARQMKQVALQAIEEQTRLSGLLYNPHR
jgi:TP901 family phage tail tape measure protein